MIEAQKFVNYYKRHAFFSTLINRSQSIQRLPIDVQNNIYLCNKKSKAYSYIILLLSFLINGSLVFNKNKINKKICNIIVLQKRFIYLYHGISLPMSAPDAPCTQVPILPTEQRGDLETTGAYALLTS